MPENKRFAKCPYNIDGTPFTFSYNEKDHLIKSTYYVHNGKTGHFSLSSIENPETFTGYTTESKLDYLKDEYPELAQEFREILAKHISHDFKNSPIEAKRELYIKIRATQLATFFHCKLEIYKVTGESFLQPKISDVFFDEDPGC
jgi:hypothetical protein